MKVKLLSRIKWLPGSGYQQVRIFNQISHSDKTKRKNIYV